MRDSSSQFFLATVLLTMLSFSIFTYNLVSTSFAYDYSRSGGDNDDNHSGDSSSDHMDNRRDRGHSGDSNSNDDGKWRDHDHSDDTNSGEGKASDSMSQADDSYGASSDDTQSGESASKEGSPNYDTIDLGASNNLAENSDSGLEISDPINSVENSADQTGTVDTSESNGSSNTDNSTSQSNVYIASDPGKLIGDGSMSNYSSNQNTPNPVDETLAAASGSMDALPSNATSSEKGGHEAGLSNSGLSNQSASSGNSREPTLINQTSTDGNLIGNQSSNTASSSSKSNSSSMRSPSAADPKDALLGRLGGSSNNHQMAISGLKTTVVNYGDVGSTNDASATVSLDKSSYTTQDSPEINLSDPDANVDPNSTNTVHVTVTSTTDKAGIPITLVETGPNTGIFEGSFSFTTGTSSATSIQIASGDDVRVSYVGTGGIIFDSTAPVTNSPPPIDNPPPINNLPSTTSGESTNTPVVIATILSSPTTEASSLRTFNATSPTASIISTSSAIPSVTARSGNKTISVPEEGNVTFSYTSLLSQGELTALPVKTTSELAVMNITQGANHKPGKLMALDNTLYIPVSTVFIIAPTDARFNGTITVVIPYNMTLAGQQAGQDVKLLHYTGSTWEDVTTFPPANDHLVTGSLSTTLGPVVAAVKSE
jgi:hypothetical protein